ncbi:hypothetical protein BOTBODRAFT_58076 [Botryobasidium botryosum FD-172 SS1]|uniref:GmrSD restriction endonucleases C-terminal domain-containing protein n=1 Tax=Botryobasidium botryosum (strain FD-172 SS1) TaxID=930990 RepID=A0A067MES8_BOTB1|nr:hypothetical protein BOTBODRAFT_58076 [Botryobasidium botryosum FD-172 SS1]
MKPVVAIAVVLGLLATSVVAAPTAGRALPAPVDTATAQTYLGELKVAADSNDPAYSRKLFPTWDKIDGTCNTRDEVMKRDGTNVVTGSNCIATSGNWISPYDNATWTEERSLDIDHLVPLKEAWLSGARDWTTKQREAFANDLVRPQLVAVTSKVNRSKGDKDPAQWLPPLTSFQCTYTKAWIEVKHYYALSVDPKEKDALTSILTKC